MTTPQKHCGFCGDQFQPQRATAKWCSETCKAKFRWQRERKIGLLERFCRQCGTRFELPRHVGHANRWHCSADCSVQSARESRSKFYERNPEKDREYRQRTRQKIGPDGNLKRFYKRHPEASRVCQSCGEGRVLDVAHRPEHSRNGAWRSVANTTPEKVWILCPTCHALLDRMHYPPAELGLS